MLVRRNPVLPHGGAIPELVGYYGCFDKRQSKKLSATDSDRCFTFDVCAEEEFDYEALCSFAHNARLLRKGFAPS